jgi:hypothetical protein
MRHHRFGVLNRFEHLLGLGIKQLSDLGRGQRSRGPVEQADAKVLFKLLDPLAGHGGSQPQVPPARGDAAQFDDSGKDPQGFQIRHGSQTFTGRIRRLPFTSAGGKQAGSGTY